MLAGIDRAQPIVNELRANRVRADSDFSATSFKAKISNADQLRVRLHQGGLRGAKPEAEVVAGYSGADQRKDGVIEALLVMQRHPLPSPR